MEVGLTLPLAPGHSRELFLAWCRRIDDGPFSSLCQGERVAYPSLDLTTALAAAAVVTERVRLIATVVVLPAHQTIPLAKQAATIDVLSGGRLTLGVGVGGRPEDYAAFDIPFLRRHQRLDEQIAVLKRVWNGEAPAEGVGPVGPTPLQPGGPPILAGAMGPKALARAARWADGVNGFELAPSGTSITRYFRAAESAWAEAGRPSPPRLTTSAWFALGPDGDDRLRAYARNYLAFMGDEMAEGAAAMVRLDNADTMRAALDEAAESGCDEFMLVPTTTDTDEVERVAEVVSAWRS